MAPYYCFQMTEEMDPDAEDPSLEDPEVLQVLSRILQVDEVQMAPDLGVLSPLITDHRLVEMDHLMTISTDLHLEEVGEVLVTAVWTVEVLETAEVLEAVVVAEVFATDLLDLEVIE